MSSATVADCLHGETNLAECELSSLPDAPLIWRKAHTLGRQKALLRATLPIRIARTCALILAIFATSWLILEYHLWSRLTDFWPGHPPRFSWLWPSSLTESTLLLFLTGILISLGLSSWYMVQDN